MRYNLGMDKIKVFYLYNKGDEIKAYDGVCHFHLIDKISYMLLLLTYNGICNLKGLHCDRFIVFGFPCFILLRARLGFIFEINYVSSNKIDSIDL